MKWPVYEGSRKAVDRAGKVLSEYPDSTVVRQVLSEVAQRLAVLRLGPSELDASVEQELNERVEWIRRFADATEAAVAWRSAHTYPLAVFAALLRRRAKRIDPNALIARRLKRSPSIIAKLKRFPSMNLSRMQDIGGCRAILRDIGLVRDLERTFSEARTRSILEGVDDYIASPKEDGYRGIHMIYRYPGRGKTQPFDGYRIEIQLRSTAQHAWATAVETVDLFQRQAIKSGQGSPKWRRFFRLVSDVFAVIESGPSAAMTPASWSALINELDELLHELNVFERLERYMYAISSISPEDGAQLFLLRLDLRHGVLSVQGFNQRDRTAAQQAYAEAEAELADSGDETAADIVLVSVDSIEELKTAYPNYFADTSLFLDLLKLALGQSATGDLPDWIIDRWADASTDI